MRSGIKSITFQDDIRGKVETGNRKMLNRGLGYREPFGSRWGIKMEKTGLWGNKKKKQRKEGKYLRELNKICSFAAEIIKLTKKYLLEYEDRWF